MEEWRMAERVDGYASQRDKLRGFWGPVVELGNSPWLATGTL